MITFEEFKNKSGWDEKWKRMADGALPVLLWCAVNKEKITYEELNLYLLKNQFSDINYKGSSKKYIGHPAGLIGEYMLEVELPIINSLVVKASTGIPGNGAENFIGEFLNEREQRRYERMTNKFKKSFLDDYIWSEIYSHDWSNVLKVNKIKIDCIKRNDFSLKETNNSAGSKSLKWKLEKYKKRLYGRNFTGESDEHKMLKDLVIQNISKIPILKQMHFSSNHAFKEYMLPSADKIDILFSSSRGSVGVEVKSFISDDADLYRGIYQCIKYKYLLQAELLEAGKYPFAECILVTQRDLPDDLKELARRFNVKFITLR